MPVRRARWRWFTAVLVVHDLERIYLRAEPSAGGFHVPLLWGVALLFALLVGRIPLIIKNRLRPGRLSWIYWLAAILLGASFLILIGPILVGLGSILITGRTM